MLPHHCVVRSYAAYGSGNHRWHIHRLPVALMAVLCATIFTKYCRQQPWMIVHANIASGSETAGDEKA